MKHLFTLQNMFANITDVVKCKVKHIILGKQNSLRVPPSNNQRMANWMTVYRFTLPTVGNRGISERKHCLEWQMFT